MGTYLLKGVYIDPKTRKETPPGETVELDDDEAHRLRYMLADPSEAKADDEKGEPTEPAASASKAKWVAWAEHVADGDEEKLAAIDGMTKEQLITEYGSES